jgi:predicted transposase/invertase (TIGR01784 family)
MSKYVDPKNDFIFKRIFGEHPKILLSFLNALLPLGKARRITELEYLPPELVPETLDVRNSIVDVRCKDNYGRQFIVEMQNFWTASFMERLLFNASKSYVRQLGRNQDFSELRPVYALALLNEKRPSSAVPIGFFSHYVFTNKSEPNDVFGGMELLLIELPRFTPEDWKHRKLAVLWLRFLREVQEDAQTIDTELLANPDIHEAVKLCEYSALTEEQRDAYDRVLDAIRLVRDREKTNFNRGKAEGIAEGEAKGKAEGLAEGEKQKALAIARKLKAKDTPAADIVDITGLPLPEIRKL